MRFATFFYWFQADPAALCLLPFVIWDFCYEPDILKFLKAFFLFSLQSFALHFVKPFKKNLIELLPLHISQDKQA